MHDYLRKKIINACCCSSILLNCHKKIYVKYVFANCSQCRVCQVFEDIVLSIFFVIHQKNGQAVLIGTYSANLSSCMLKCNRICAVTVNT